MKIGIITYDRPHRKTQDLVFRLWLKGYSDITLLTMPFIERKKRIILWQHRNNNPLSGNLKNLVYVVELSDHKMLSQFDKILIGGANILPDEFIEYNIINSHPGYLPNVRGLDALKWAIYNDQSIGVTTHIIKKDADMGTMIDRRGVDIYFEDTFHTVANRVYELELDMLVESMSQISATFELTSEYPINKRMPLHLENVMIQRFENMRIRSMSIY